MHSAASFRLLATAEDALSSRKAPTSVPPDHPVSPVDEFERLADLYLVRSTGFEAEAREGALLVWLK